MTPSPDAPAVVTWVRALKAIHTQGLMARYCSTCHQIRPCDGQRLVEEVERREAVVEAARGVINCVDPERDPPSPGDDVAVDHAGGCLWVLVNALEALDASPTPEQAGQWRCRCGELHPADLGCSHYPVADAPAASRGAG